MATYPKQIMSMSELLKMGFPEGWLNNIANNRYLKIAWRSGNYKNSKIMFDTEELEKYRRSNCTGGLI